MPDSNHEFLNICVQNEILMFGKFTLKSGRISPYFFNAGNFDHGNLLAALGTAFARLIADTLEPPYMLYGPAYKGIPIAAATAVQLSALHNINVPYAFNRKEAKDHGEGGVIVGAPLTGNVVILDDVITAGTSVNESVQIIRQAGAEPHAICIALDRQEIADGESLSAAAKVSQTYDMPVHSLIRLDDLIDFLGDNSGLADHLPSVREYRSRFGYNVSD